MPSDYHRLTARLSEVHSLQKAAEVLEWDQQVYMPRGGAEARTEHYGVLKRLAHERFVDVEVGRLIAAASQDGAARAYDSDEAAMLRWARREYDLKRKMPTPLVEELARQTSLGQELWVTARAKNDFPMFRPTLEKIVDLKRRQADALGAFEDPYDAWLAEFEPGMKTSQLNGLFVDLKAGLLPLVKEVAAKAAAVDDAFLHQNFDVSRQRAFCDEVARAIGFDFDRGRQDLSAHPFSTSFSPDDVRIPTRLEGRCHQRAFFGTMHEAGHGMYEQGVGAPLKARRSAAEPMYAMNRNRAFGRTSSAAAAASGSASTRASRSFSRSWRASTRRPSTAPSTRPAPP